MGAVRLLVVRRLRHQPLRAVMAVLTMAAGVSLAVTVSVIDSSVRTSIEQFQETLAGVAPLRVVGATRQGGIDESLVPDIEAADGVAAAVPMVQAVSLAENSAGEILPVIVIGIDCRAAVLFGQTVPCTDDLLAGAGDQPLAVGNGVFDRLGTAPTLRTSLGTVSLRNAPGVSVSGLDRISGERVVLFSLAGAQRQFGRNGAVDVVYVTTDSGASTDAVSDAVGEVVGGRHTVLSAGAIPGELEAVMVAFIAVIGIVGLVTLGTGAVLIHNTVRLSMEERRRQLAIVAAVGGTPKVVAGSAIVEAGLLGIVGGLLGAGGGAFVGGIMMTSLSRLTENLAGVTLDVHVGTRTVAIGALLGLLTGVGASLLPARRALRLDVAAELSLRDQRERSRLKSQWGRTAVAALFTAAGLFGCVVAARRGGIERWQATLAPVALFVMAVSALLLTVSIASVGPTVVQWARPITRFFDMPTRLGLSNLIRDPRRTMTTIAAVSAAVGIAFTTANFNRSVNDSITKTITSNLHGVTVTAVEEAYASVLDVKLTEASVDAIAALPEVDRVERNAQTIAGTTTDDLVVVTGRQNPWLDANPLLAGSNDRDRFFAGEAMIGPVLARDKNLRPGDHVRLATRTGSVDVPVQGVWQDGNLGGRAVTISYELFERLYGQQTPAVIGVIPKAGVGLEQLKAAIEGTGLDGIHVSTPTELAREVNAEVSKQFDPIHVMERWMFVVAFIAVLSTMLLIGVQRHREMGLLAAVGMRPSEMGRMVLAEGGLVGLAGCLGGAIFGVIGYYAMMLVLSVQTGIRNPFRLDIGALITSGAIATLLSVAAAGWPAWRAARVEVVEALQYE